MMTSIEISDHNFYVLRRVLNQTADHIISTCPLHRAPKGIQGLLVLDDDTRRWLKINAVNI